MLFTLIVTLLLAKSECQEVGELGMRKGKLHVVELLEEKTQLADGPFLCSFHWRE